MPETESPPLHFDEFAPVSPKTWREHVRSDLGGTSPEDFLEWTSKEGVSLPAYLGPDDLQEALHTDPNASFPPLAGADASPANEWAVCQSLQHPDPETANEHARTAVSGGVDALELDVLFPGPDATNRTHFGDSDLATVFDGVDLAETDLHLGAGLPGPVLYTLLRSYLSDRTAPPDTVTGSVLYDPVASVASGTAPDRAFALAADLRADAEDMPRFRTVTVDAGVYHDAGASVVQEVAFALGALTERLARGTDRGASVPALSEGLQVRIPISTSYFVEMAKLRALRLLVPQVIDAFARESGTTADVGPADVFIYATTSHRTETIYDPHVNMLRATTEAMSAVLGGCDTLTVRPYDAVIRPPDAFGLRIARNVQLILEHEAHLDQVADPAAGSYYVETLTDRLAQKAWTRFQELEAEGGIIEALRTGMLQQRITKKRKERREAVDQREHVLVGTTHYPSLTERRRDDLPPPDGNPSSNGTADASLRSPSLDAIRSAVRDGATPSEIIAALRSDDSPIAPLPRIRVAEEIEAIRLRTEAFAESHDGPPQVLLAPLGPPAARSARATFARNFLGVAGFAIEEPLTFESVEDAADAAVEQDADIVVLCSSNSEYADLAPALASALDEHGHSSLLGVAGPPDDVDAGEHADFCVHQGSSLKETLVRLQERLDIDLTSEP